MTDKQVAKILEKVSPRWSKLIREKGVEKATEGAFIVEHKKLDITNHARCIVGEAYGFKNGYASWGKPTIFGKEYCKECDDFGYAFCSTYDYEETARKFVKHFKEAHQK